MLKNIFKSFKSTILGLAFLGFSGFALYNGLDINNYIVGGLIISGILLFLAPDKYINILEKAIKSVFSILNKTKKDEQLPS